MQKCPIFSSGCNRMCIFSIDLHESTNITFYEKPSSGSRVNTYGQTDMTKLLGTFRGNANASEMQVRVSTLLDRESETEREKVLGSVFIDWNVFVHFCEFCAEIKCKQYIIVKSCLLSCTCSCPELDGFMRG
jgi:hypothetical protein